MTNHFNEHMLWHMPRVRSKPVERQVKIFRNGRNRAVRIPREFEFPGDEALMRKEGDRLILEPLPKQSILDLLATWGPLDEEFPEIEDTPPEPFDL